MRPEGWEARLADVMKSALDQDWEWGVHDCGSFAHRCASAVVNGATPWDQFLTYSTEVGAARLIKRSGGIPAILDVVDRINPLEAQRGDIGVARGDGEGPSREGELAVGVFDGRHFVLAAKGGLARWPVTCVEIAWPVR